MLAWFEAASPPQFGVGRPSRAAASAYPYLVGVKNSFVSAWFTNQNFQAGVFGKFPATAAAPDSVMCTVLLLPLPLLLADVHAASSAEAAPAALTSPVPASSLRRDGPSFMFSVCIASSTLGSIFFIADLQLSVEGELRRWMLTITSLGLSPGLRVNEDNKTTPRDNLEWRCRKVIVNSPRCSLR